MENSPSWAPCDAAEAASVMVSCAKYLAGHDYAGMDAEVLVRVIAAMEQVDAGQAATRARALTEFGNVQAYTADGYAAAGPWLVYRTGIDQATANAHRAWVKRRELHPVVLDGMEELDLPECVAKRICKWTGKLPQEHIDKSDEILVAAYLRGANIPDLADIAAQIAAKLMPPDEDDDKEPDGNVRIETTIDGAAVLSGELEPACAAVVQAAFEQYGAKRGDDDQRSQGERYHEALAAICRHVLANGMDGAGSKRRSGAAVAHINLGDAAKLAGYSEIEEVWKREMAARWAGQNARAAAQRGDGGVWLTGKQADLFLRDALITPVVIGSIDPDVIPRLAETGHLLHQFLLEEQQEQAGERSADHDAVRDIRKEELVRALLTDVIAVVAGPGGYASFLRTHLFAGSSLGGRSLPLDVGEAKDVPPQLRKALGIRDQTCAWAGGCGQPAARTEPHHIVWRSRGGRTKLDNLGLGCFSHHHIMVHQHGWDITLNPDGTTTVHRPDGTIYHRRGIPPAEPP